MNAKKVATRFAPIPGIAPEMRGTHHDVAPPTKRGGWRWKFWSRPWSSFNLWELIVWSYWSPRRRAVSCHAAGPVTEGQRETLPAGLSPLQHHLPGSTVSPEATPAGSRRVLGMLVASNHTTGLPSRLLLRPAPQPGQPRAGAAWVEIDRTGCGR